MIRKRMNHGTSKYEDMTKPELIRKLRDLEAENLTLRDSGAALDRKLKKIRESEHRYKMIFDHSYISIWEEDYSAVLEALRNLKKRGIRDIKAYLLSHPEEVSRITGKLKVIDVNPATLKMYNTSNKEELLGSLDRIFVPEASEHFIEEMTAIALGARHYEGETVGRKISGEKMNLLLRITIPESGNDSDYSNVLVGIIDITEQKRREQKYLHMLQVADSLRATSLALTSTMNLNTVLDTILDEFHKVFSFSAVTVALFNEGTFRVVRHRSTGSTSTSIRDIQKIYNHPDTLSIRKIRETLQPVLIADTRNSSIWKFFESTAWVHSYLSMPIRFRDNLIGLVSFYSESPDMFSEQTIRTIEPFVLFAGVALENARLFEEIKKELTEKVKAEKLLRKSLEEKKILLMEIHHRVKNNLNIVASLLNLQADQIETVAQARNALQISQNRVHSMSVVHENLYQSEDLSHIDFSIYLRNIAEELVSLYQSVTPITLNIEAEDIYLGINQAVPLGLMLNELITNALTHAFTGRDRGSLSIHLTLDSRQIYHLTLRDDGIGIPDHVSPDASPTLGLHLSHVLAQQLGGVLEITGKKGTTVRLSFPREEPNLSEKKG